VYEALRGTSVSGFELLVHEALRLNLKVKLLTIHTVQVVKTRRTQHTI
jgi:hypothetical protein